MKQLLFQLTTNDKKVIDRKVNYYKSGDIYNFKIDEDLYQFDSQNIILTKKDQEKEININFLEKLIIITILENNIKIDYPLEECYYDTTKNSYKLFYVLDSDNPLKNSIVIDF